MAEDKVSWTSLVKDYFGFKKPEAKEDTNFDTKFDKFEKAFYQQNEIEAKEPVIPDEESVVPGEECDYQEETKDPLQENMYGEPDESDVVPHEEYLTSSKPIEGDHIELPVYEGITEDELKAFKELNGIKDEEEPVVLEANEEEVTEKPTETKVKSVKVSKPKTPKTTKSEKKAPRQPKKSKK